jgi:peptidoglycan L-alanyl-D-glutamate endopeptidase CwlK
MSFTPRDVERLQTCHRDLNRLFFAVERAYSCMVIQGHRGQVEQDAAFAAGKSQLRWPRGKHNSEPSLAVDVAPLPLNWNNREAFIHFAGFVQGVAAALDIPIRWGGDWNGDRNLADNRFDDLVHYELAQADPPRTVVA